MFVRTCVRISICTCIHIFVCTCIRIIAPAFILSHLHSYYRTCIRIHVRTRTCVCVCVCIRVRACIHIRILRIRIHIRTRTQIRFQHSHIFAFHFAGPYRGNSIHTPALAPGPPCRRRLTQATHWHQPHFLGTAAIPDVPHTSGIPQSHRGL
ncbi:hypothetical protein RSAG8_08109, partial [Rhizoctonia solani AG-8 WAC10335]